jgi:5-methylcytosine-specific restriction endonuclease McrA
VARTNSRNMHKLRDAFKAESRADNAVCWLCKLPIDYAAAWDDWDNDDRFQLDHLHPVSTHPELQEDPDGFRPSHAGCNNARSNKAPSAGLGVPSRQWV